VTRNTTNYAFSAKEKNDYEEDDGNVHFDSYCERHILTRSDDEDARTYYKRWMSWIIDSLGPEEITEEECSNNIQSMQKSDEKKHNRRVHFDIQSVQESDEKKHHRRADNLSSELRVRKKRLRNENGHHRKGISRISADIIHHDEEDEAEPQSPDDKEVGTTEDEHPDKSENDKPGVPDLVYQYLHLELMEIVKAPTSRSRVNRVMRRRKVKSNGLGGSEDRTLYDQLRPVRLSALRWWNH
jgi:hypothetical protein